MDEILMNQRPAPKQVKKRFSLFGKAQRRFGKFTPQVIVWGSFIVALVIIILLTQFALRNTLQQTGLIADAKEFAIDEETLAKLSEDVKNLAQVAGDVTVAFKYSALFTSTVEFQKDITAPNILYELTPGTGITLSGDDPQRPIINNTGVLSVNNLAGGITLAAGNNIDITTAGNTLTITSTSPGISVASGSGLELSSGALSLLSNCDTNEVLSWDGDSWECDTLSIPDAGVDSTGSPVAGFITYWASGSSITGKSTLFFDSSSARVGIGTSVPSYNLEVSGSVGVSDGVTIGSDYTSIGSSAPSNGLIVEGNVGIGTSSPAYKLDVNGSLGVTGTATFTSGVVIGSNFINNFVGSGLTIANNTLELTLTSGSGLTFSDGTLSLRRDCAGGEVLQWSSGVWGCATVGGVGGDVNKAGSPQAGYLAYWSSTSAITGDSTLYFDGTNFGIGTTDPTYLLDVNGTVNIGTTARVGGGISINGDYISDLTGGGLSVSSGALTNTGVTYLTGTANQITVSAATGAVTLSLPQDIGTGSTVSFGALTLGGDTISDFMGNGLTVSGNTLALNISSASGLEFSTGQLTLLTSCNTNEVLAWTGAAWSCQDVNGVGGVTKLGSPAAGYISYWVDGNNITGESALFYDPTNDRVGIGTTSPSYALDVSGAVRVGSTALISGGISIGNDYITDFVGGGLGLSSGILTNTGVTYLTGTANQVTVSSATGAVTLSLPQDIATGSTVTFGALTLGGDTISDFMGNGLTVSSNTLSLNLATGSGLEFNTGQVSLLRSCSSNEVLAWNGSAWACASITGVGGITKTGSPAYGFLTYWSGGNSISGESSIYYDATNDRLGIGTTAPGQSLSIAGTFGILEGGASPQYYSIFQGGDQAGNITYTLPVGDGSSGYVLTTDGSGSLSWLSATGGAVGAGDISAVGNISAGDAFTSGTPGTALYFGTGGFLGIGSTAGRIVFTDLSTDSIGLMSANIGIATTSPAAGLDVQTTAWLRGGTGTSGLYVNASGNIGVGTTNPSYTLDVNGAVNIGSTAIIGSGVILNSDYITDLTGTGLSNAGGVLGLSTSGITAGTYGSSTLVPVISVDATGRINSIVPTAVAGGYTNWLLTDLNQTTSINSGSTVTFSSTAGIGVSNAGGTLTFSNTGVTYLTGSSNQVTVSSATGSISLSLPQDIGTGSTVTFGALTVGGDTISEFMGSGLTVSSNALSLKLATAGSGVTASFSGLQVDSSGLRLLSGCSANQVLAWISSQWVCTSTSDIGGVTKVGSPTANYISYWVDGNNITGESSLYYDPTNHRVGIGTTSPSYALDIAGALRVGTTGIFTGGINLNSKYFTDLTGTGLSNAGGSLQLASSGVTSGTYGSSTSIPIIMVDAFGRLTDISSVTPDYDKYSNWILTDGTLASSITAGSTAVFTSTAGIGVSNSGGRLTFSNTGVTYLTGAANQISVSSATGAVTLALPQDIGTSSNVTFGSLTVGGDTLSEFMGNGLTVSSNTLSVRLATAGTGVTASYSGLQVDGSGLRLLSGCSSSQVLSWDGAQWTCASVSSGISGTGVNNYVARWTGANTLSTGVLFDNGTNVGVGLTNPGALLDVAGTAWLRGGTGATGLFVSSTGNVGLGKTNPAYAFDVTGSVALDGSSLFVNATNHRVGIGKTTPSYALDVVGNAAFDGSSLFVNATSHAVGIGTTVPSALLDINTASSSVGVLSMTSGITTGTAASLKVNSLSTGTGFNISSTSTALTSGRLMNIEWLPGSTSTATGDLFRLNIGSNGYITGNLFALYNNGSDVFKVGTSKITSAVPHEFSATGDLSVGNDIVLTNQVSNLIQSYGPLTIESGEVFENQNLTLRTFGTGNVVLDLSGTGGVLAQGTDVSFYFDTKTPSDTDYWMGVQDDGGNDDDDSFMFGKGLVAGTNAYITVTSTGNVGIGTTNPGSLLTVNGAINATFASASTIALCYDGTGSSDITDCNGSPADIAEMYSTQADAEPGDIVSMNTATREVKDTINSSKRYDSNILGVVSTFPSGDPLGEDSTRDTPNPQPIGLLGRVPVKVNLDNGTIRAGDPITSSTRTGVGMKATGPGRIVGYALEDYDGSTKISTEVRAVEHDRSADKSFRYWKRPIQDPPDGVGKIMIYLNPSWQDPTLQLATDGTLEYAGQKELKTQSATVTKKVDDLQMDVNILENKYASLSASMNKMIQGTSVNEVASLNAAVKELELRADLADEHIASLSARIAFLEDNVLSGSGAAVLGAHADGSISTAEANLNALTVTGDANVYNLGVTGSITAGLLTINGYDDTLATPSASINTIGGPLRIQPLGLEKVEFMNGKVEIDQEGNMTVLGKLNAKVIRTEKLEIVEPTAEPDILSNEQTERNIGESILKAGKSEITIETPSVSKDSRIYVTFNDEYGPATRYWISDKKGGTSFTITLDAAVDKDVRFSWLIVN